jgi:hypothetical protein
MSLFVAGMVNANLYAVLSSTSSLFAGIYPYLSETELGLCYLSIGGGMFAGSLFSGKLMDRDYRTIKNKMIKELEASTSRPVEAEEVTKEENFPIEKARLRTMPVYAVFLSSLCIGYGWMLEKKVNIAGPLIFQFASECSRITTGAWRTKSLLWQCLLTQVYHSSRLHGHGHHEHRQHAHRRYCTQRRIVYLCLRTHLLSRL